MLSKILTFSFYILFFLTPLFWTPLNYELFEYNKMMLVYGLTVIITGTWLIKMVIRKSLIVNRTPLDIPIFLFLGANVLSTIFSIDPHTSLFGYYSRSNGGLLSLISYILLYYALVSNLPAGRQGFDQALNFLKAALLGGALVALWAIPEHFGVSPSCVILTGQYNATCWVQDVQARVFASLGQPNWLAAYLAMLIFPALYFFLTAKTKFQSITYYLLIIIYYLAFTFTYSRGATLGLLGGLGILIVLQVLALQSRIVNTKFLMRFKPILIILTTFLVINLLFGSSLTGNFKLIKEYAPPREAITSAVSAPPGTTQLESGGTESGKIRLIVWEGALEIFKHNPILGSGMETFAYSYYNFRPISHNLVSEWDFLYNKAHNEYLNYLATTGLVGFLSYLAIIITFLVYCIKYIVFRKDQNTTYTILHTGLLASYISYLIQNLFQFSVVIIALFFFTFPAFAFIASGSLIQFRIPSTLNWLKRILVIKIFWIFLVIFIMFYLLFTLLRFWIADTHFAIGTSEVNSENPGKAYNELIDATRLNPLEPLYKSELGFTASSALVVLPEDEATLSAQLKEVAQEETQKALDISPKNVSLWRTAVRTYYLLSTIDPSYNQKTLDALDKAISLAPTDPRLYYNKALILGQMEKNSEAIEALKKAIELKPNYRDAIEYSNSLK